MLRPRSIKFVPASRRMKSVFIHQLFLSHTVCVCSDKQTLDQVQTLSLFLCAGLRSWSWSWSLGSEDFHNSPGPCRLFQHFSDVSSRWGGCIRMPPGNIKVQMVRSESSKCVGMLISPCGWRSVCGLTQSTQNPCPTEPNPDVNKQNGRNVTEETQHRKQDEGNKAEETLWRKHYEVNKTKETRWMKQDKGNTTKETRRMKHIKQIWTKAFVLSQLTFTAQNPSSLSLASMLLIVLSVMEEVNH